MNAAEPQDLEYFRSIRGVFATPRADRFAAHAYAILFIVALPAVFAFALLSSGLPRWPLTADQWTVVALLFVSPAVGYFLWFTAGSEWHFTGTEVSAHRRGRELWRVPIDSITDAKINRASHNVIWLHLTSNGRNYSIRLVPDLLPHFTKVA